MPIRVLLIDDNLNLTRLLSRVLVKHGFEVSVENNSFLAMEAIRRMRPDVLLLDVIMPGRDGAAVLSEVRMDSEFSELPVILLTALGEDAHRLAGIGGRASMVLGKPVEFSDLVEAIESQLCINA